MSKYQRPFLKWAGNKFQILDAVFSHFPSNADRLIEPFVGSGAVFLNALNLNIVARAHVGDSNPDITRMYAILRNDRNFIDETKASLFYHPDRENVLLANDADSYYRLRNEFNELIGETGLDAVRRRAQLFIYLNRHGFNGLCRYNSKGGFNVPKGSYKKILFPSDEMLKFHELSQSVIFENGDFKDIVKNAAPTNRDVVYFDPPYLPLTSTANFTAYSSDGGFGMTKQIELAKLANQLAEEGVTVIVSNHDTALARQLYAGAICHSIQVNRYISAGKERGKAAELFAVFTKDNFNVNYRSLAA